VVASEAGVAEAQQVGKVYRVDWLRFSPRPPTGPNHVAFRRKLHELGYVEDTVDRIVKLAVKLRLPAMYTAPRFVRAGGLMYYGRDRLDIFRRAAIYVDKILKGAKPADLPVEQPTKFDLVINLKRAKQLSITIPSTILYQATKVIK
jgi:hypothetical protein